MSSGTRVEGGRLRRALGSLVQKLAGTGSLGTKESQNQINARVARLGMTPRQQELNWLWAWYRTQHYETRRCDWDGKQNLDAVEHEAVATAGFLPPGFYDAGATLPIKFRRPKAPYALPKVIVDRFTGLLFSERHHPQIRVEGDADTEDFIAALVEESRLWAAMIQARTHGGGMGTACIGFQFVDGKPEVEVHDPRWVTPTFVDRTKRRLRSVEIRYMYTEEVKDPETGIVAPMDFWHRRIINTQKDVLFAKAPVGDGSEPEWAVEKEVEHGFDFCPVYWVQNLPVQDDVDGDPDCQGVYEIIESMDALLSQAMKGTISNCDPTVVITTKEALGEIRKGSDNCIKVPDGSASYMEMSGSGIERAMEQVEVLRRFALEVAQCVLEHPDQSKKTATEIERSFASMLAKADVMREQYGEKGIKLMISDMVTVARKRGEATAIAGEGVVRQFVTLPPKTIKTPEGTVQVPRKLGPGGVLKLQWPHYFEPVLTDINLATTSAAHAKVSGLIDNEHASKFVAEYFMVEDVQAMLKKIKAEADAREDEMAAKMMGGFTSPEGF